MDTRTQEFYDLTSQLEYGDIARIVTLGIPHWNENQEVCAYVALDPPLGVYFHFSSTFWDSCYHGQRLFVVQHESLHLALRHFERGQGRLSGLWNIACDVVINEALLTECGRYGAIKNIWTAKDIGLTAEDVNQMTAEQVYDYLLAKAFNISWAEYKLDGKVEGAGEDGGDPPDNGVIGEMPEKTRKQLERIARDQQRQKQKRRYYSPIGTSTELRELRTQSGYAVPWEQVLHNFLGSVLNFASGEQWIHPARKLRPWYPRVLLPSEMERDVISHHMLVALDVSGSMYDWVLAHLIRTIQTLPDSVKRTYITFDTQIHDWSEEQMQEGKIVGGGGTSFQIVADYAEKLDPIPDVILVLTDGYCSVPIIQNPAKWCWIICPGGSERAVIGRGIIIKV